MTYFRPFGFGILQVRCEGAYACIAIEDWEPVHDSPKTLMTSPELRNLAERLNQAADEMDAGHLEGEMSGEGGKVLVRKARQRGRT